MGKQEKTTNKQSASSSDKPWQFKPGHSGNPAGRPLKENTFSDIARELLASKEIHIEYTYPKNGRLIKSSMNITSDNTINHTLVAALVKEAMDGNVNAARELIDRTEGRSKERVEHSGKIEGTRPIITVTSQKAADAVQEIIDNG